MAGTASSSPVVIRRTRRDRRPPAVGALRHRRRLRARPRRRARARRRPRRGRPRLGDARRRSTAATPAGHPGRASTPWPRTQTDLELAIDAAAAGGADARRGRQRRGRAARPPAGRPAGAGRAVHTAAGTRVTSRRGRARPGWPRSTARGRQRRRAGPGSCSPCWRSAGRPTACAPRACATRCTASASCPARAGASATSSSAPTPRSRSSAAHLLVVAARRPGGAGMRTARMVVLAALLVVAAGCVTTVRAATTAASGGAGHPDAGGLRLVRCSATPRSQQFTADTGIKVEIVHRRRRRRGAEPGDPHQGQARGRRAVGRRQHAAVPGRRRGHLRALRVARAGHRRPGRSRRWCPATRLTPVDYGDVCVNYDKAWFAAKGIDPPTTLDDLDRAGVQGPARRGEPGDVVARAGVPAGHDRPLRPATAGRATGRTCGPTASKVVNGWTEAYTTEFSGSSGKGPKPLVVSYASSPPAEIVFADRSASRPSRRPASMTDGVLPPGRVRRHPGGHRARGGGPASSSTSC